VADPGEGGVQEPPHSSHPFRQLFVIWLVASLILIAISLAIDWFPTAATKSAHEIDTLYDVLLIVSVPIFTLVMTVAIYSVWRFRARPGDMRDGAPIHGNTRLEIAWVSIPLALVLALAVYAWIVLNDVEAEKPNELHVHVVAQQFTWHFEYPQYGNVVSDQLYLPNNRPVKFDVNTKDVIHSFWVPSFRLKTDTVPGITTHIRVTPDRLGKYEVVCAELCGAGHSVMRANVHVIPPAAWLTWVKKQGKPGSLGGTQASAGGQAAPGASASTNTIHPG
jgi:cytochrome c oxidase subunit 2